MATRRTIDSLINELAELRGISRDSALRQALSEALEREEQEDSSPNQLTNESRIRSNCLAQFKIASIEGALSVIKGIKDDFLAPYLYFILILGLLLAFRAMSEFTALAIVGVASLPFYGRFLTRKERVLKGVRQAARNRINGPTLGTMKDMDFLLDGSPDFNVWPIVGMAKEDIE